VFAHDVGEQFAISEYELSARHDVRPLVLKTLLTYLELDGYLQQGTPFYAGYSVRPADGEWDDVFATFDAARADFLRTVVRSGKTGRVWTAIDPEAVPGEPRARVVAALDYLEQRRLVELKVADVRQRYTVLTQPPSRSKVCDSLVERFDRRERSEVARIERVLALVEHDGCQVQELVGYFGEQLPAPCGHCTFCLTGERQHVSNSAVEPIGLHRRDVAELAAEHEAALGSPRQQARFLCGLTSPATTRARLTRHPLFGALAQHRFVEVLAWCDPPSAA
jgi:ATP-dependent DNA helicase RecQ